MKWEDLKACEQPYLEVLTQKEYDNLQNYLHQYGMTRAFNLAQNCDKLAMVSKLDRYGNDTLFALLRSGGLIWYGERFFTGSELAICQGLAVERSLSLPRSTLRPMTCPFSVPDEDRGRSAMVGQIGNGMSVPVVGAFLQLL